MPQEYRIPDGYNIYDALLANNLPIESAISVISESGIDNIGYDLLANTGVTIKFNEVPVSVAINKKNSALSDAITIYANDGQSLYDIALMTYGNIENLYALIQDNNFGNTNYTPKTGDSINFRRANISNISFYNELKKNNHMFNTGYTPSVGSLLQENGFYILLENGGKILL